MPADRRRVRRAAPARWCALPPHRPAPGARDSSPARAAVRPRVSQKSAVAAALLQPVVRQLRPPRASSTVTAAQISAGHCVGAEMALDQLAARLPALSSSCSADRPPRLRQPRVVTNSSSIAMPGRRCASAATSLSEHVSQQPEPLLGQPGGLEPARLQRHRACRARSSGRVHAGTREGRRSRNPIDKHQALEARQRRGQAAAALRSSSGVAGGEAAAHARRRADCA